jgi:hypothetical protein
MKTVGMFFLFVPVAVSAGQFSMVLNQISYSVSNEYFTKLTFIQSTCSIVLSRPPSCNRSWVSRIPDGWKFR